MTTLYIRTSNGRKSSLIGKSKTRKKILVVIRQPSVSLHLHRKVWTGEAGLRGEGKPSDSTSRGPDEPSTGCLSSDSEAKSGTRQFAGFEVVDSKPDIMVAGVGVEPTQSLRTTGF